MRKVTVLLSAILVLFVAMHLRAADATFIPPSAVSDTTVCVGYFDVSAVSMDDFKAMLKALLGQQASLFDEQLPDIEKMRKGFTDAGGKSLAFVAHTDETGQFADEPVVIVNPASPDNLGSLQSWLNELLKDTVGRPDINPRDGYLALNHSRAKPLTASAERYALLTGQLAQTKGTAKLLLVPTDAMRQAINEELKSPQFRQIPFAGAAPLLVNAKWVQLVANAGEKPTLSLSMEMPDEAQAQQLAQIWAGLTAMGAQAVVGQLSTVPGAEIPDPMQLMQQWSMKQTGSQLSVTLDTPSLAMIGKAAAPALIAARAAAHKAVTAANMRQLGMCVIIYATDHDGQMPDSIDQLVEYAGGKEPFTKLMTHPVTKANPGYVYVKPAAKLTHIKNSATTVIFYEAGADGKPNMAGIKCFADGHVETPRPQSQMPDGGATPTAQPAN